MRQPVAERIGDRSLARLGGARPVPLPVRCVAKGSRWIPMPILDGEFGVQSIRESAETGAQHQIHTRRRIQERDLPLWIRINRSAERAKRADRLNPVLRV